MAIETSSTKPDYAEDSTPWPVRVEERLRQALSRIAALEDTVSCIDDRIMKMLLRRSTTGGKQRRRKAARS